MTTIETTETLIIEWDDGWVTVWLNRPDVRNAISARMVEELTALVERIAPDRAVRGVSFRGKGGTFCAGGDLRDFRALAGSMDAASVAEFSRQGGRLFHAVDALPQVTVMMVEGAAMAGGLGLAAAGDFVLATADAKFALTETQLGIPPAQIAPMIVRRTGSPAARRMMLTAARFDADEALRLGLVDEVLADAAALEAREAAIRAAVRQCAPQANAETKRVVQAAGRLEGEAMVEFAAEAFARCLNGPEGREGVASFLEKRKPAWALPPVDKP
jgi:isohexenylglutaconyl-CoA hydratase